MDLAEIIRCFDLDVMQFVRLTNQQLGILWYICQFGSVSPMEAFSELGVTKLATRVSEMKSIGIRFDQAYESRTNRFGKTVRYMRYRKAAA